MKTSSLEAAFDYYWRVLEGPALEAEYRFDTERKFRLDFAHLQTKVGIECDGATWTGGRHSTGKGYTNDCIKLNLATALGWRIFRLTSDMLKNNPEGHLMIIKLFIARESEC